MKYISDYDYDSDSSDGSDSGMAFVINNYATNSSSPCTVPEEYEDWQVQPWMSPVTGRFDPNQSALVPIYSNETLSLKKPKYYKPKPPSPSVEVVTKVAAPRNNHAMPTLAKTCSPVAPKRIPPKRSAQGCQWCGTPESSLWRKHPQHGTICTACYASNRRWGEIRRPRAEVAEVAVAEPTVKKARLAVGSKVSGDESPKSIASEDKYAAKNGSISSTSKVYLGAMKIPKGAATPSVASDSSLTLNEGIGGTPTSLVSG